MNMTMLKSKIEALDGVEFVHVTENDGWLDDSKSGLAPKSFKVYVLGGKKKEVAKVIWENKMVGVLTEGNTQVRVLDSVGFKHSIRFERLL